MDIIKLTFIPALFLFSSAAFSAPCALTDVTTDILGGPVNANACINSAGNDNQMGGQLFADTINSQFGTVGNWSQLATNNAVGALSASSGTWDFSALLASITNPFVFTVKASNEFAAYLFNVDTLGTGSFSTIGLLGNPVNMTPQDISHYSIYTTDTMSEVPIPAAIWLFAPALMGLMGFRRKNKVST